MWRNPNKFFHDIIKFIGQPGGNICGIERPKGKWLYQNIFPQLPETSNTPYEKELATGFVVIPYIQGATEPIKRILNNHNVQVSQKPFQTLGHIFAKLKDPVTKEQRTDAIYYIPCNDCDNEYI